MKIRVTINTVILCRNRTARSDVFKDLMIWARIHFFAYIENLRYLFDRLVLPIIHAQRQ